MTDDISALRDQLQQLKAQRAAGALSAKAYDKARAPLERQLLDGVMAAGDTATSAATSAPTVVAAAAPARPGVRLSASLAAAVVALAGAGYWWTGSPGAPSASSPGATRSAAVTADGVIAPTPQITTQEQFAAAVEQLAQRLQREPDNAEGWAMLARSYARLGRFAEAVPAFVKAVGLQANDANLLADYADTLAVRNNRSLEGEPKALIERALAIDPRNTKALWLAGSEAFDRKDYAGSVSYWERLVNLLPADSSFGPELQGNIDKARAMAGMPKSESAQPAVTSAAAGSTGAATTASTAAPATPVGSVQGRVRLSPEMARLASPTDTVFIFARAAEGPRMPLAILRYQVKDLPLDFKLDDSSAMSPAMRLSLHKSVVISARVSKSGQAAPTGGDLTGQSPAVANTAQGVQIEINELIKN